MKVPDEPARRARPAHRCRVRAGAAGRRPLVRRRAAQRTVRDAAAQCVRGDARPAVRQVPVHRVRRAAAAAGVRPRRGHADRAAGCAAARGDLRWRHPRPRPVHRVPGIERRLREALPGRRTRRGDGVRVPAGRRHLARRHQLAHHRDHPRPRARHPRARRAGPVAVLARRRRRQARRAGRGDRRVHRRAVRAGREEFAERCAAMGFNDYATDNLWQLLDEQRQATGTVPTDTTFIVERFRDELGDWRVILHSPYGLRVHGPLALAVVAAAAGALRHRREAHRLRRRHHRAAARHRGRPRPAPTCSCSTPTRSIRSSPTRSADRRCSHRGSANARPAPCCLPRRHPGKRSPLWHQRQRAAQLLDVARKYPDFPIVLETVRECLQDVYDVPTLTRR